MLKKIMVGAIVSVFLLAGCSNGTEKSGEDGKTNASATLTPENQLAFYEDTKKNERVWLQVYAEDGVVEKDFGVENIIFAKDGKLTIYNTDNFVGLSDNKDFSLEKIKISDLNGKSFEELKKLGVSRDKEIFEAKKSKEISSLEYSISISKQNALQTYRKDDEKYQEKNKQDIAGYNKDIDDLKNEEYKAPKATEISIATETDASGNTTIDEDVIYNGKDLYRNLTPMPVVTIYDTHYGGYIESPAQTSVLLVPVDEKYVGQIVTKLDDEVKEK